jgi:hypothetical protein
VEAGPYTPLPNDAPRSGIGGAVNGVRPIRAIHPVNPTGVSVVDPSDNHGPLIPDVVAIPVTRVKGLGFGWFGRNRAQPESGQPEKTEKHLTHVISLLNPAAHLSLEQGSVRHYPWHSCKPV